MLIFFIIAAIILVIVLLLVKRKHDIQRYEEWLFAPSKCEQMRGAPVRRVRKPLFYRAHSTTTYSIAAGMAGPSFDAPLPNSEEYRNVQESGFKNVSDDSLSTLSADVDTASYCAVRAKMSGTVGNSYWLSRYSNMGSMCRVEEMLNYFTYDYAKPSGDARVAMTSHLVPCPWNEQHMLLQLGVATGESSMNLDMGRNIVLLVDVSGSMRSDDKLPLAKIGLKKFAETMREQDVLSLVTYASGESVVLDGVSAGDYELICGAIDALVANGATFGEAGLKMAYELAEKHFIKGGVNRIVMLSDGDLNVGMQSESELHKFVESKRDTGVYLSVLGFGLGNYKDNRMSELGDAGNGAYHYIDCEEECDRVFVKYLTKNLVPFADDMKVQVEFNPSCVSQYRLIGYEKRELANSDFKDDDVNAANVGPEEQFTVCYELVMADEAVDIDTMKYQKRTLVDSDELCSVAIRYRLFDDGCIHEDTFVVSNSVDENMASDTCMAVAIIECAQLLKQSEFAGTSSVDSAASFAKDVTTKDGDELRRFVSRTGAWLDEHKDEEIVTAEASADAATGSSGAIAPSRA
jgi:Ca-activated chloride channel family protein